MKKISFITISKKSVVVCVAMVVVLCAVCFVPNLVESISPKSKYVVVIDAGHGGLDVK